MRQVRFADFDLQEYKTRAERMQRAMDESGIDLLIITNPANMRYLFGFQNILQTSIKRTLVGLLPKENIDGAALFIPADCQGSPQTWVEDVHFWHEGHAPPFDETLTDLTLVINKIDLMGLGRSCIGFELGFGSRMNMPVEQIDQLRKGLNKASLVDATPVINQIRAVKSEVEINILRQISRVSLSGIRKGFEALEEGLSEAGLCRLIHAENFLAGADGMGMVGVLFGVDGFYRANMYPTDFRRLKRNEWINVDGGDTKSAYCADMCRMAVFGKATRESLACFEAIVEANHTIINTIRPGIPCSELYRVGMDVFKRAGFANLITTTSVGHGIGLNNHEMPDLHRDNNQLLVEGMVLCVEPWIADPDMGALNLEDMVIVRENGAELITSDLREKIPFTKE